MNSKSFKFCFLGLAVKSSVIRVVDNNCLHQFILKNSTMSMQMSQLIIYELVYTGIVSIKKKNA